MFTLNDHIEYLMMHHDCVVIPGWGALVAQYSEPFYDASRSEMEKPVRRVGFNASVSHNDGLLAQSLVRRERLTYDEAVRFIDQSVTTFRQQLAGGGELSMGRLGFFHSDGQGRIEFIPFYHEMCNDQYFGLRSVKFTPLEELQRNADTATTTRRAAIVRPNWLGARVWQTAASVAVLIGLTVVLTTPIIRNNTHHDMASLSITHVTGPQADAGASIAPAQQQAPATAAQEIAQPANALLLDEGGDCYLVVSTLNSQAQADEYLAIHPDIAKHSMIRNNGKHYYVCVARAATPTRLYAFMGQLPKAYGQSWVLETGSKKR